MIELFTEQRLRAPPPAVWRALMDFPAYGDWNRYVRRLEGSARLGARLTVTVAPSGGPPRTFHPLVTRLEPEKVFAWRAVIGAAPIFAGEHIFELEAVANGTRLVHREEFSGLITPLHRRFRLEVTRRGFETMNADLAGLLEAGGPRPSHLHAAPVSAAGG
jgi:hypothetical protein